MSSTSQKKLSSKPQLLKDFLILESNSCSSNGFSSFPRTIIKEPTFNSISTFQAILNAVKNFTAVMSPSILPRSFSRMRNKRVGETKRKVITVKDIIRWRSFRDVEDECRQLDSITGSTASTSSSSSASGTTTGSSSWCESDFNLEAYLPCGEIDDLEEGKNYLPCVGICGDDTCHVDPKEEEEKEQRSPVSVITYRFNEDEDHNDDHSSCFYELEVDETNEVEEKAWQLLSHMKQTCFGKNNMDMDMDMDKLLLDFFIEELKKKGDINDDGLGSDLIKRAKGFISNEEIEEYKYKYKEVYIKAMDKEGRWSYEFEEEKQELGMLIENVVIDFLVNDLLRDIMSFS